MSGDADVIVIGAGAGGAVAAKRIRRTRVGNSPA